MIAGIHIRLVPIAFYTLLLCALLGWVLQLTQQRRAGVKSPGKNMGKILLIVISGAVMAGGGCFGLLAQIGRTNHREGVFIGLALSGLAIFAASLLFWTALGIWYLISAIRKRSTAEVKTDG